MKTDTQTKSLLAVIALALVSIAGQGAVHYQTTVHAAQGSGAGYQYKILNRNFSVDFEHGFVGADSRWIEEGQPSSSLPNNDAGLGQRIEQLGADGWELVSVIPLSQYTRVYSGNSQSMNGVTTKEELIFKKHR